MRYVAAYMLLALGGKENPTAADLEKVLSSVGIEADGEKLKTVISQLSGKNLEELISKGMEKLASMPSGGGAAAAAAAPAAATGAAASPEKKEEKEAKKEVQEEESDDDMGFGLFD
ncbi:UNVERIFIED_CONTAM: hypothetical protein PYX00_009551 [Menopon gallinae]|uniref:Large ribosomal subunit protein P2 n=1 Tax=Menopon gallinae TaxID=328185 RepID=A0AAW2HBP7_9NEOP